jgi:hypothetical protein
MEIIAAKAHEVRSLLRTLTIKDEYPVCTIVESAMIRAKSTASAHSFELATEDISSIRLPLQAETLSTWRARSAREANLRKRASQ